MALKTLLWAGFFGAMCVAALAAPIWGIVGYVGHYSIGAERQWWEAPLSSLGLRYSFTLAACTALGIALTWNKLRFGRAALSRHEKVLLLFLGIVWLSVLLGPETVGRYTGARMDHPSVKLTKIVIFTLMLTHVVTDRKNLDRLLWTLVIGAMILGMQAWDTPRRAFVSGRLERVGGPDFSDANFFAAYMGSMLWLIGVQFLRSGWRGKIVCFLAGGFAANAVVLARSRGAVVGLAAGAVVAVLMAPKRYRRYLAVGLVLAGLGFLRLADEQFLDRTATIFVAEEERDASAESRILLARAGVTMWMDYPLGVGAGNFYQTIGAYIPEYAGKDAHNTYIRCLTELGTQGIAVFGLLILSAFATLRGVRRGAADLAEPVRDDIALLSYGMTCALTTLLACCLTMSLTYVEFLWWILMLPACLGRVAENALEDDLSHSAAGAWRPGDSQQPVPELCGSP